MTPTEIRDALRADARNAETLIATLYGEARGESLLGQVAVGCVVRNRMAQAPGRGAAVTVCLAEAQFSCWWGIGANVRATYALAEALLAQQTQTDVIVRQLGWVAGGILSGEIAEDVTHGATHYLAYDLFHRAPPKWAAIRPVLATIGNHVFLRVT